MAQAILLRGGSGGISSDDVTAGRGQVLQGYTTVTTDSDDEVVEGTIKVIDTGRDNNNFNKQNTSYGIDGARGTFYIDLPHGDAFYRRDDGHPHTCIDADKLGNATTDHVLNGSTFTSKNGMAVRGTMPNRGTWVDATEAVNATWENSLHVRLEPGYYAEGGGYKPTAKVPYAVLASALGIDAGKMLSSLAIAGRQGRIKMIKTSDDNYKVNKQNTSYGIDGTRGTFFIDMPHGNAYYYRDDDHPHTCIDAVNLGDAGPEAVLQGVSASSAKGLKFSGGIPRWTSPSHVVSAVNNEGFVWDDDTGANRGRGIVSKIPTGHYIQNASFVFLPSGNLYPQNVVKGININGVTGTRDWADRTNEYVINANVSVDLQQNGRSIALGNAFSSSETIFIGVDLVGIDTEAGFVRRDKGNGRYNIGRIPLGKNDSNFVATFIRRCPVQVELARDWAGNMSFILHIPDGWSLGQTQFYVYIYGHSSMQNNF